MGFALGFTCVCDVFCSDRISMLQASGQTMGDAEGIDIVATLGQKGGDYYSCSQDFSDGSNIMSIFYAPHDRVMYVRWTRGPVANEMGIYSLMRLQWL